MNLQPPPDFVESSPGVFTTRRQPVVFRPADIDWLRVSAARTPKRRARACAHSGSDRAVHEMIIVLDGGSYVRPHRHHGKSESMHAITGRAAMVYFRETGEPDSVEVLGAGHGDALFSRTEQAIYHTVLVLTEDFVFHETVQGPLQREATEFAPWAPDEADAAVAARYQENLRAWVRERLGGATARKAGS